MAHERSEKYGVASEQDEAEMMTHGLDTMWKMGKLEIEKNVRSACKNLLKDKSKRKKRAQALKDLGELYRKESNRVKKEKGMEKGTFFDFVQKAAEDNPDPDKNPNGGTSPTGIPSPNPPKK